LGWATIHNVVRMTWAFQPWQGQLFEAIRGGFPSMAGKQDVFPFDGGASIEKELPELGSVIFSIFLGIEAKKNSAAGVEVSLEIVQKKSPFRWTPPPVAFAFAVEIDRESSD